MPSPTFQTESQGEETQDLSEFGNQFLQDVPEEHRHIVEQYIKPWDGNVTKKFQELQGKLKPYEELGDPAELQSAYQILSELRSNPVEFYNSYRDYLIENGDVLKERWGVEDVYQALGVNVSDYQNEPDFNGGELPDEFEGVPQQFVQQFQQMQERLESLDQNVNEFTTAAQEQEQMKILDQTLDMLHTNHGEFDDTFVLTQIASGKSPDEAIQAYETLQQSIIDSHSKTPPPNLMNGPGGTPLDQVDATKLKDAKTRKEIGTQILSSLQQR